MGQSRVGNGQTALITGASMGIGVDLAECFVAGRLRLDPDGA
jgi:short-subunit dehydrogenase